MQKRMLLIILLSTVFFIGCHRGEVVFSGGEPCCPSYEPGPPPWAPAHGYRAKYYYYYYPSAGVYYDVYRRLYFYYEDGRWRVSATLPTWIRLDVHYVSLEMDTDKPYKFHSEVKKRYPPGHKKNRGRGKGRGWGR
ncbi:MAG: hypothetical protein D6828_03610 [Nitrospirae bacterium]|nr:MAG: hypothetical protein D6828_03610 [Nitrospirota bacterium]